MSKFWQKVYDGFNIKKEAEDLGVSLWQAPSFLFILMGLVIIAAMTGVYFIAQNYNSPEIMILSESSAVAILFTIGNFIIRDVEEVAKANKMKTEFVSIASHQLKTPLTEINWEIELLMSKCNIGLDKKQCELIEGISIASKKMTRLVNDLLDVARIDQGRLSLENEIIDISEIIEDVSNESKVLAQSCGVNLICNIDQNLPKIRGDKHKLSVSIDNLISNGIKYTKEKGEVEIKAQADEKNILIMVKDNGVGIAEKEQDKIFQKFYRINDAENKTEGTGLGLFIAKNIIEHSGGKIWFESEKDRGTIFWVSLPIVNKS